MTKITFVVLLCCIAAALASPTGQQLDTTIIDQLLDEGITANNIRDSLRNYMESRQEMTQIKFQPKLDHVTESSSEPKSSWSENDQGQAYVPQKSFKDNLARFMKEVPCPQFPHCYRPSQRDTCGTDDRRVIVNPDNTIPNQWVCRENFSWHYTHYALHRSLCPSQSWRRIRPPCMNPASAPVKGKWLWNETMIEACGWLLNS